MICIIDCNLGNLRNVQKIFEKFGINAKISQNYRDIEEAEAIVLPGVGAFGDAVNNLRSLNLIKEIRTQVLQNKKPILGICLGMQLLGRESAENHGHEGLNLLPMSVKKLDVNVKLPHIGWNTVTQMNHASLLNNLPNDPDFYFVHSYHAVCDVPKMIAGKCNYGQKDFVAAIQYENIFGTQFHPEKSQAHGIQVIDNFIRFIKDD